MIRLLAVAIPRKSSRTASEFDGMIDFDAIQPDRDQPQDHGAVILSRPGCASTATPPAL